MSARMAGTAGFTLIELLIGLVLLAITLTIAFAALRFSGRSLERTDILVHDLEDVRVVGSVMQQHLAQARPLMREAPQRQVAFRGESQVMEFVAPVPSQEGRLAGMYHYRLRLLPGARGMQLLLDHQAYVPDGRFEWGEEHATTVVAGGLSAGRFSYFGQTGAQEPEGWSEHWTVAESLPRLVQVQLDRGAGAAAWPDLVVPLRAHRGH